MYSTEKYLESHVIKVEKSMSFSSMVIYICKKKKIKRSRGLSYTDLDIETEYKTAKDALQIMGMHKVQGHGKPGSGNSEEVGEKVREALSFSRCQCCSQA